MRNKYEQVSIFDIYDLFQEKLMFESKTLRIFKYNWYLICKFLLF